MDPVQAVARLKKVGYTTRGDYAWLSEIRSHDEVSDIVLSPGGPRSVDEATAVLTADLMRYLDEIGADVVRVLGYNQNREDPKFDCVGYQVLWPHIIQTQKSPVLAPISRALGRLDAMVVAVEQAAKQDLIR